MKYGSLGKRPMICGFAMTTDGFPLQLRRDSLKVNMKKMRGTHWTASAQAIDFFDLKNAPRGKL
ncbi:hypothetical protein RvVAR031_18060 [Agrobacterium vitis]|nr:hypothetical protein RvVAR031_18060 [Agrobacterium vitis]